MFIIVILVLAVVSNVFGFTKLQSCSYRRTSCRLKMADTFKVTLVDESKKTTVTIDVASDKYILEAALDAGVAMDYSCNAGTCSTCVGKCTTGEIDNSEQSTLQDDQLAKGFTLTCVAYAKSDCTILINEQQRSYQDS